MDIQEDVKEIVVKYFNSRMTDEKPVTKDNVCVMSWNRTLTSWNALVSSTSFCGIYYVLTRNRNITHIAMHKYDRIVYIE